MEIQSIRIDIDQCKVRHDGSISMQVMTVVDGRAYCKLYIAPHDHFKSFFDHMFETATREIKQQIIKEAQSYV